MSGQVASGHPDLGPGPRRWKRAQAAYDAAVEQRDRDIAKALRQRTHTGQEIADAFGLTREYLYTLVLEDGSS